MKTKRQLIKLIKYTLEEISITPKENVARFNLLKRKGEKYVKQYQQLMNPKS